MFSFRTGSLVTIKRSILSTFTSHGSSIPVDRFYGPSMVFSLISLRKRIKG